MANGRFLAIFLLTSAASGPGRAASPSGSADWVWWEAEAPKSSSFPGRNPFGPWDEKGRAVLSDGKWIGASDAGKVLFLEYEVEVSRAATYQFYCRKFWQHGPFRWRFGEQPWKECGRDVPLLDSVELAKFIVANWVSLGPVTLGAGKHLLRLETLEPKGAAAFDCFLLATEPFTARGRLKPGEKFNVAPEGWFPFEPDLDPFRPAALDLRSLNEKFAGEGGFIQVRGDGFVHQRTGRPVRFWAINSGHEVLNRDPASMDRFARRLAKLGVNMVRLHGPVWREGDPTAPDEEKLAKVHRFVAALKREGIYLNLSSYFPLWLKPRGVPGLEGFDGKLNTFAIPFFNERFQEMQKGWWKSYLTTPNPHTGLPLGRDPALAFIEIQNEDGLFFWTFTPYQNVPAPQMEILERRFGGWLGKRYGSVEAALSKWGGAKIRGDDAAAGRAGFLPLWELSRKRDLRARDTAEFLAGLQRQYYDGMYRYLKTDLAFQGCVAGSNWVTAEPRILGPLDKWSNAGCDFLDRHGYYDGPHQGERAAFSISNGDRFDDASALRFDGRKGGEPSFGLPLMDLAYNGKPSTISEINWTPPNRYRADMPIVCAAWGALQGSDAFAFFASADTGWTQTLGKFTLSNPACLGQFPAAALLYRKGLVKTGDTVVRAEIKLSDLYALRGIPLSAPQNLDEFRRKEVPAGKALEEAGVGSIDPLAFLAGRVEVNVTEAGGASRQVNLSKLIDREKKTVRSATGELVWDYGRGLATIDAPQAQGVTGFLSRAGRVSLGDVTLESPLEYGSLLLVSLDDRPLAKSGRLLLQVMSEDRNYGWSAPGEGLRAIVEVGGPPLVVRKLAGRVSLRRPDAGSLRVTALDFNGYPDREAKPGRAGDLALLPTTFYYLIGEGGAEPPERGTP